MQVGLSTQNAPSVWVVAPHYLVGTVSFILASVLMVIHYEDLLNYHLTPTLIAITHLMILGWVSIVIFGALYQLIPVVMEVKIYSEKLAYATLGVMVTGLIFLITGFLKFEFKASFEVITGASFVIAGVVMFAFNTLKSAAASQKKSISRLYIIASGLYLLLNVSLGLFMVLNMSYNWLATAHTEFLKAHLVVGLIGWFLMLIIGVAARLLPMFLIVHKLKEVYLKWGFYLLNSGILLSFTLVWIPKYPKELFAAALILILAGLILFLLFSYDVFSKRMRKKLDSGMKPTAIALIMFALSLIAFAAVYAGNDFFGLPAGRLEIVAGILMIYGFFTGIILGQTYKTLPFIIWLFHYQKLVGRQKTPLPGELFNEKFVSVHTWTFVISVVLFVAGLLFSIQIVVLSATATMLLTSMIYGYNSSKMIFHKKQTIK
jgi:cbb3-type cytochrome oxidase subunit 1